MSLTGHGVRRCFGASLARSLIRLCRLSTHPRPAPWLGRTLELRIVLLFLAVALPARAELVIIVNPQSGVEQLSKAQVINIFLGNHREMANGVVAKPIDLPAGQPEKGQFYRALVNKDLNQMAAYWSRLVFAGNTAPPVSFASATEVIQQVSSQRGAIAYVDRKNVDPARVRIVYS